MRRNTKMTYREIAEALTEEEGVEYTPDQVRMICNRAMDKIKAKDRQDVLKMFLEAEWRKS